MDLFVINDEKNQLWFPAGKIEIERYMEFIKYLQEKNKMNEDCDGETWVFEHDGKKSSFNFNRTILNNIPKDTIINHDTISTNQILGVRFSDLHLLALSVFKKQIPQILDSWINKNTVNNNNNNNNN